MSELHSDNTLPKSMILRSKDEVKSLFDQGTFKRLKFVTLIFMKTELQKVGFFVTKRHGNAVRRNKVKRWLREIYRMNKNRYTGYTVVFLVNRPSRFSYNELSDDVLSGELRS